MALTKSERTLFNAIEKGNLKQVKTALKKVSDLDFEGDYGRTPLEQAIYKGHLNIVKELVEAGADKNRVNDYDQTPLDTARAQGETKIATWLKSEGALKKSEVDKQKSWSRYDDDNYFTSSIFDDDDDDWRGTSRGKPRAAKKASAPKKTAAKGGRAAFGAAAANDAEGETGAKTEKANQPVKPKFSEETLKDVFNAKNWVGKTEEMEQLWQEVPVKLQKKFDFDTSLAEAKRETLRQNAPPAPKLQLNAPPAPPATPDKPAAGQ